MSTRTVGVFVLFLGIVLYIVKAIALLILAGVVLSLLRDAFTQMPLAVETQNVLRDYINSNLIIGREIIPDLISVFLLPVIWGMKAWFPLLSLFGIFWVWRIRSDLNEIESFSRSIAVANSSLHQYFKIYDVDTDAGVVLREKGILHLWGLAPQYWQLRRIMGHAADDVYTARPLRRGMKVSFEDDIDAYIRRCLRDNHLNS